MARRPLRANHIERKRFRMAEEATRHSKQSAALGEEARFPSSLLYAINAKIGAHGLGIPALETLKLSYSAGFLGKAVCWDNLSDAVPNQLVHSLRAHPARLLSWMSRKYYTPLKRRTVDHVAARELATGRYDCFHGWSGESLKALREAKKRGIPTLLDIPTWHRDKGKRKPRVTKKERDLRNAPIPQRWLNRFLVMRSEVLEEYDLADLILVFSEAARKTFLDVGFDERRLVYVAQGVNVEEYPVGSPPDHFRIIFVGSLIKRKGVHHLLKVWKQLNLKDAELVIVGALTAELEPYVREFKSSTVTFTGFVENIAEQLGRSTAFVFPSESEGSAKVNYEAAACGLAQITTRESGDVVIDGFNGRIIPPNDPEALAEALLDFYNNPQQLKAMGENGRKRVVENFTWEHYRKRLAEAYRIATR
jgi:glycosyltransferase involved in cell wall biosynthesis